MSLPFGFEFQNIGLSDEEGMTFFKVRYQRYLFSFAKWKCAIGINVMGLVLIVNLGRR